MDTMLAGRFHIDTKTFQVEEIPVPAPGPGEVLIEVKAAGVCLSDLHVIDGTLAPPFATSPVVTIGHEVSGVIHTLGPELKRDVSVGDRVALVAGQTCDQCADCARRMPCRQVRTRGVDYDGGWAQFTIAREDTLVPIPDQLPFDQAAIIPDAVSTSYAALVTTAQVRPAQAVGVWGIGGLGAHSIRVARLIGATPIIAVDPLPAARQRALDFGADLALDPAQDDFLTQLFAATEGRGLDFAIDCAGVPPVREQATAVLGVRGALVLVGIAPGPITVSDGPAFNFVRRKVIGHYGSAPEQIGELVRLVSTGRLDLAPSISDHLPLAKAAEALHRLEHKTGDPIRLILVP